MYYRWNLTLNQRLITKIYILIYTQNQILFFENKARTVHLYFTQSFQKFVAENLTLIATESPNANEGPRASIPAEEW